jgi:hypothetical protein
MGHMARVLTEAELGFLDALINEAEKIIRQLKFNGQEDNADDELADDRGAIGFLREVQANGRLDFS